MTVVVQEGSRTHRNLFGSSGDDTIVSVAAFTTIFSKGGNDVIVAETGYVTIDYDTGDQMGLGLSQTITLAGQGNRIVGNESNFKITDLDGGLNDIAVGGRATTIVLAGSYNKISVGAGANTIDLLGGNNVLSFFNRPSLNFLVAFSR